MLLGLTLVLAAGGPTAAQGAKVVSLVTCREVTEPGTVPVGTTTEFDTDTPVIHAVAVLDDLIAGATLVGTFVSVDAIDIPNYEIASTEVRAKSDGDGRTHFELSRPDRGWPPGQYRFDLLVDGRRAASVPFSVVGAGRGEQAPGGERPQTASAPNAVSSVMGPLLGAAPGGGPASFAGRYRMDQAGVSLTLALQQAYRGDIAGTLESTSGARFQIEGQVQDDTAAGSCIGNGERVYFEARFQGGGLLVALIEPGPDGQPDYGRAQQLLFRRIDTGAGSAGTAPAGRLSPAGGLAASLLGTWRYQGPDGPVDLVFESAERLRFDGEPAEYALVPGAIRLQSEYGPQDYPYALEGDTLTLDFPEGYRLAFRRAGATPDASAPRPSSAFPTPGGSGMSSETAPAPPGATAGSPAEVGHPQWGFAFRPPAGWKSQHDASGAIMGHDRIPGMIVVMPHSLSSLEEVRATMQNGLSEEGVQLSPSGPVQPLGPNAVAGDYSGVFQGQRARARGIGTFSGEGTGAYVVGVSTPEGYSRELAQAADELARSMRYLQVDVSDLVQHFAGTWVSYTQNTSTYMTLRPDGTYSENYEANYGGQFTNQYGTQTGNWGAYNQDQDAGRWTVRGTREQGTILITLRNGNVTELQYQVHREKGQTYWREYWFNGKHYGKK